MTIEKLKEVVHATPFLPFLIRMADGREVNVRHPDFISMSPTGRILNVFYGPKDASIFVDVLLITSIEVQDGSATQQADA